MGSTYEPESLTDPAFGDARLHVSGSNSASRLEQCDNCGAQRTSALQALGGPLPPDAWETHPGPRCRRSGGTSWTKIGPAPAA